MRKLVLILTLFLTTPVLAAPAVVQVYKSPSCGCCDKWVEHMRAHGFAVEAHGRRDMQSIKERAGIRPGQGSCHTAFVGRYTIEGHVPAADVKRLLEEEPEATGLTVPGMPMGSPGMEGPYSESYKVLLFGNEGTRVFSRY